MSDMVNLTIDGNEISVPKGTLVVDAAKRIEIEIPVFCYHPKLDPVGMCRLCMVEIGLPVIDRATGQKVLNPDGSIKLNFGKGLQTSCTVVVSEGMVVRTQTDPVKKTRADMLEFLLTSHPLDCPVCDKGGECPLQDLTMVYGYDASRMDFRDKIKLDKRVPLGELIVLDKERCIQCARCIRFQDEVVDDPVIEFHNRGRRLEIVTFTDPGFDSYWSGNTTDICPVGALTTSDFRFGARPWELNPVASICPHCPVGCNTTLDTRREATAGGRRVIKRIVPRQNEAVNEIWICDKGRFVHHFADAPQRLHSPLVRRDGRLEAVSWDDALDYVADKLKQHKGSVAGVTGERLSNEDYFEFQRLFRQGLGSGNIDLAERRLAGGDVVAQVGISRGSNLLDLGKGDAILVVAADLHEEAPVWWLRVKQAADRGATLVVLNARATRLDKHATHSIRCAPGEALTAARELLTMAYVDVGAAEEGSPAAVAASLMEAENLVIFYGAEGLTYQETDTLARTLANLLLLKRGEGDEAVAHAGRKNSGLVPVWSHANTQGAWDMGIHPAYGPGYSAIANPGLDAAAIYSGAADGSLEALFVLGTDPVGDELLDGRGQLSFLVVQELFMTETAAVADVVLPAQSWAEREGTFTSGERRVQRYYPAIPPAGEARPDWQILAQIGERVGMGKAAFAASLVFKELAKATAPYKEMDYRTLTHIEPQWPIIGGPEFYYGGTAHTNKAGLGQQWASAAETNAPAPYDLPSEPVSADDGGFRIMRIPSLYTGGTLIDYTKLLHSRETWPTLFVNPVDAAALSIVDGDDLTVVAEGETYEVETAVSESAPSGVGLLCGISSYRPMGVVPATVSLRAPAVIEAAAAD
ncbi:MAG: NADH-quinone oxidoreductase subunit NuoG [Candidatus Promineofilum sp.]|nr:NADH-quinone oxidoreductase subunit NuoG [Promineifilum sp.]MBP9656484.1 NADH-quinone oxidoreductase subunit NuoG [Promineifilum sp.]